MHLHFLTATLSMNYLRLSLLFSILALSSSLLAEQSNQELENAAVQMLAEPRVGFISDQFYVPLRTSPCSGCKIVHKGLKTGTKLSIIGHQKNWSLVTTNRGYKGWIRNQHILNSQIARVVLAENANKVAQLQKQNKQLEQDMQHSFELIGDLRKTIADLQADRKSLSKELATIKTISSKEIVLNKQNQVLVKHNHMLQEERDVLRANVDDLQNNKRNQSFLYGGFVAFLGAILTALIPRLRGRKRLSEWR